MQPVQRAEGGQRVTGGERIVEVTHEHDGVGPILDHGFAGVHSVRDCGGHHAIEQRAQAAAKVRNVELEQKFAPAVDLLHIPAAKEDANLQAHACCGPQAGEELRWVQDEAESARDRAHYGNKLDHVEERDRWRKVKDNYSCKDYATSGKYRGAERKRASISIRRTSFKIWESVIPIYCHHLYYCI